MLREKKIGKGAATVVGEEGAGSGSGGEGGEGTGVGRRRVVGGDKGREDV